MEIKSILVPTDFTELSRYAVDHADHLARRFGCSITLLHVVENLPFVPAFPVTNAEPGAVAYDQKLMEQAREHLQKMAQEISRASNVTVLTEACLGYPAQRIVDLASSLEVDLIVIGTNALSGKWQRLLGSVAARVVRTSKVPVLTVNRHVDENGEDAKAPKTTGSSWKAPQRILLPTDLSENSMAAAPLAALLARTFEATINVVTIMEDPALNPVVTWDHWPLITPGDYYDAQETHSEETVDKLIAQHFADHPHPVNRIALRGRPRKEIVTKAHDDHYDLIIMGTHGRTGFKHVLLGSVAEGVVRTASCPVLTVRASGQNATEEEHPEEGQVSGTSS